MPESLTLALALALDCGSQTNSCYLNQIKLTIISIFHTGLIFHKQNKILVCNVLSFVKN